LLVGLAARACAFQEVENLARVPAAAGILGVKLAFWRHLVENPESRKFQIYHATRLDGQTATNQLRNAGAANAKFGGKLSFADQNGHGTTFKVG
jgi:hypothetical protein